MRIRGGLTVSWETWKNIALAVGFQFGILQNLLIQGKWQANMGFIPKGQIWKTEILKAKLEVLSFTELSLKRLHVFAAFVHIKDIKLTTRNELIQATHVSAPQFD